jgi:hypothetical protein
MLKWEREREKLKKGTAERAKRHPEACFERQLGNKSQIYRGACDPERTDPMKGMSYESK